MTQKLYLDFKLPSLNEYINSCRTNRFAGAKRKKEIEEAIYWAIKQNGLKPIMSPCSVAFTWHEGNKKRDIDNVAFAKKFILDALQTAQILKSDSSKFVVKFTDEFVYCDKFGVQVIITEV